MLQDQLREGEVKAVGGKCRQIICRGLLEAKTRAVNVQVSSMIEHCARDVDSDDLLEPIGKRDAQAANSASHLQRAAAPQCEPQRRSSLERSVHLDPAAGEELVPIPTAEPLVGLGQDRPLRIDATEVLPVLLAACVREAGQHANSFACAVGLAGRRRVMRVLARCLPILPAMPVALVLCTTILGATFLAGLHPAPKNAFEASGTLVVPAESPGVEQRTRQAAALLAQPSILATALETANVEEDAERATERLSVDPHPSAGVVGFRIAGATSDEAKRLAEGLGAATVEGLRLGGSAGPLAPAVAGDFEGGLDNWSATGPENRRATISRTPEGKYGDGSLRIRCSGARGCGASRSLSHRFSAGRTLAVTAWVRSRQPSRVRLTLGNCCDDGVIGRPRSVGGRWRRLELGWTPLDTGSGVVLALQNVGSRPTDVDLDAVAVRDTRLSPQGLTPAEERGRFGESASAVAPPVRVVSSGTGSTLAWGAAGACLGLLIGLIGLFAARLSRRRIPA